MTKGDPISAADLRATLREAGLRATSARVAVLRVLLASDAPRSHAEVYEEVQDEGFDRATVYRNLVDLADAGLARRSDLGDHVWRFESIAADEPQHQALHPHFVCSECGTIACLPDGSVAIKAVRGAPKALRDPSVEVQLRGLCDACV